MWDLVLSAIKNACSLFVDDNIGGVAGALS